MTVEYPARLLYRATAAAEERRERSFTYLLDGPDASLLVWGDSIRMGGPANYSVFLAIAAPCCGHIGGQIVTDYGANARDTFLACNYCVTRVQGPNGVSQTHQLALNFDIHPKASAYAQSVMARQETTEQWLEDRFTQLGLDFDPLTLTIHVSSLVVELATLVNAAVPYLRGETSDLPFADAATRRGQRASYA